MQITETKVIPEKDAELQGTAFQGTKVVEVVDGDEELELVLEYSFAEKYGRRRRSVKVRRRGSSRDLMTFIGGDRWGVNKKVVGKLQKSAGRGYIQDFKNIDDELRVFDTSRLRRFIEPRPGRRVEACWAVQASEEDIDTLVAVALTQEAVQESAQAS